MTGPPGVDGNPGPPGFPGPKGSNIHTYKFSNDFCLRYFLYWCNWSYYDDDDLSSGLTGKNGVPGDVAKPGNPGGPWRLWSQGTAIKCYESRRSW